MTTDQLDILLGKLREEGQFESEGDFTLDKKHSRTKWQDFTWENLYSSLPYVLQLGYLFGSQEIKIDVSSSSFLGAGIRLDFSWDLSNESPLLQNNYAVQLFDDPALSQGKDMEQLWCLLLYGLLNAGRGSTKIQIPQLNFEATKTAGNAPSFNQTSATLKKSSERLTLNLHVDINEIDITSSEFELYLQNNLPWLAFLHPSQITVEGRPLSRLPEDLYQGPIDDDSNIGWFFLGFEPDHQTQEYPLDVILPQLNNKQSYHDEEQLYLHNGVLNKETPWIIDPWLHPIDPSQPKAQITSHHQGVVVGTGAIDKNSELLVVRNGATLSRHAISDGTKGLLYFLPVNQSKTDFSGLNMVQDQYFKDKLTTIFEMLEHSDQTITANLHRIPTKVDSGSGSWFSKLSLKNVLNLFVDEKNPLQSYLQQRFFSQTSPEDCLAMAIAAITPLNPDQIEIQTKPNPLVSSSFQKTGVTLVWKFDKEVDLIELDRLNNFFSNFSEQPQELEEKLAFSVLAHHPVQESPLCFFQKNSQGFQHLTFDSEKRCFTLTKKSDAPVGVGSLLGTDSQSGFLLYVPLEGSPQLSRVRAKLERTLNFHQQDPLPDITPLWQQPSPFSSSLTKEFALQLRAKVPLPLLAFASSHEASQSSQIYPDNIPSSTQQIEEAGFSPYQLKEKNLQVLSEPHQVAESQNLSASLLQAHGLGAQEDDYLTHPKENCQRYYIQTYDFERDFTVFLYSQGVCFLTWKPPVVAPGLQAIVCLEDAMAFRGGPPASWLNKETERLKEESQELRSLIRTHLTSLKLVSTETDPKIDALIATKLYEICSAHHLRWIAQGMQFQS